MGALLAIATFALFILIDYLITRRAAAREGATEVALGVEAAPVRAVVETEPRPEPVWVAGYDMPEQLHYHRGHMWARVVGPDTVAVGLDDFAPPPPGHGPGRRAAEGRLLRPPGRQGRARRRRGSGRRPDLAGRRRGRRRQPRARERARARSRTTRTAAAGSSRSAPPTSPPTSATSCRAPSPASGWRTPRAARAPAHGALRLRSPGRWRARVRLRRARRPRRVDGAWSRRSCSPRATSRRTRASRPTFRLEEKTMEAAKQRAILFDMTRCSGCGKCVAACMRSRASRATPSRSKDLSATAYTAVARVEPRGRTTSTTAGTSAGTASSPAARASARWAPS